MNIWNNIKIYNNLLILGFGREGQSTYSFIRKYDKDKVITIADKNETIEDLEIIKNDLNIKFITGDNYLDTLNDFDLVIKTPGISLSEELLDTLGSKLTSQADLFLKEYRKQIIGVTGTKGKSTTVSFIYHFLQMSGRDSMLVGNIGIPPFNLLGSIKPETVIVFELSSHMLQRVSVSPHFSILLNVYPEHLDYHGTIDNYAQSKANIFRFQDENDFLAIGKNEGAINLLEKFKHKSNLIEVKNFINYENNKFIASHQIMHNIILGAEVAVLAGANKDLFLQSLETFKTLPHRLQVIGTWKGITFIDDSISTIPEAAMVALEAYPKTDILILGGMDRGIPYENFVSELSKKPNLKIFCLDVAGKRIYEKLLNMNPQSSNYFLFDNLEELVKKSYEVLSSLGGTVLLSPAAASYTQFKNFEERGDAFAMYAMKYNK